jgi:hypothetical protein
MKDMQVFRQSRFCGTNKNYGKKNSNASEKNVCINGEK